MTKTKTKPAGKDEITTDDLPEGWALTKFGCVAIEAQNGFSGRTGSGRPTVVLRLADVSIDGTVASEGLRCIGMSVAERQKYSLRPGDLLAFRVNGSAAIVGQVICYMGPAEFTYCDHFIRFRVDEKLFNPLLVAFLFRTIAVRNQVETKMVSSAGQNTVSQASFREIEIPLPPFSEQSRIVSKIEELIQDVNACRDRLARVPKILKGFRQAVLAAACSGRLTADWRDEHADDDGDVPAGWMWKQLNELLTHGGIFDGPFGSNLKTADYTKTGVRVIRLENIGQLRFIAEKETYISQSKYDTLKKHTVDEGDIIFASFIDEEVRACVLPRMQTKAIAKADCFCIRPNTEIIDNRFLTFQLVSRESFNRLFENVHGATRPRINTTQLRKLELRWCPLPEQTEIVRRVEALFKLADAIEKRVAAATARADKLTLAILAKAFCGELVPTEAEIARREGRGYEPASALLARIRSENNDAAAANTATSKHR